MELSKITDSKKNKIIADYVQTKNYSETARMNGVSDVTVRKITMEDPSTLNLLEQKKEEDFADVIKYMDSKKDVVCGIIGTYLSVLTDAEKLEKASLQQIATSLGIIIDKFTKENIQKAGNEEEIEKDELSKSLEELGKTL